MFSVQAFAVYEGIPSERDSIQIFNFEAVLIKVWMVLYLNKVEFFESWYLYLGNGNIYFHSCIE